MTNEERLRALGIEWGPKGLTDESIEWLRAYYKEHGELPPEYESTLVERAGDE